MHNGNEGIKIIAPDGDKISVIIVPYGDEIRNPQNPMMINATLHTTTRLSPPLAMSPE